MLVSAPATAALDALLVSLAPALDGEHSKTSATAAFKNVLDDLTLLEDGETSGNAEQQSAAAPQPGSKKQQPQASGSAIDPATAPQTAGIMLPPARLTLSPTGLQTPPDENATPSPAPAPSNGSDSALPPHDPDVATATATVPRQTALVTSSASSPVSIAKSSTNSSVPSRVSLGTAAAQAPIPEAGNGPIPQMRNAPANPSATAPGALENIAASSNLAVAPSQAPSEASISNPTPLGTSSAQQPKPGKFSAIPHNVQESPHIIAQEKSGPVATTGSAKNSPPPTQSAPLAPGPQARANTTTAASLPTPSTISSGVLATLPAPSSHDVLPGDVNPAVTPTASSEQAITPSQQPVAKTNTSDTGPQTRPSPQFPPGGSGFTAPSTTPAFFAAPVPVTPALGQAPQAQAAMPAPTSSVAPSLEQAAAAQAKALPTSPVTSAPAAAPARESNVQPAADRTPQGTVPLVSQSETPGTTSAPKSPLLPQAENLAFAMRLLGLDDGSGHAPPTQSGTSSPGGGDLPLTQPLTQSLSQPKQPASQSQDSAAQQTVTTQGQNESQQNANQAAHETDAAAPLAAKSEPVAQNQPEISAAPKSVQQSHPGEASIFQVSQQVSQPASQIENPASGLERNEAVPPHVLLAAQETRLAGGELPKSSASSEIFLHLAGDGQSAAAIRVADRAGAVNVSVHAADPVLRESLKTNLGDLSAQLNVQGWKTETTKSAPVAAHSDNPQDSHGGGQRGSGQQGSGDGRQPQRERRGNGGQWRQALDQQITGNETHPGGKR